MPVPVWDLKSQFATYQGVDVFDCLVAEFLLSEGKYAPSLAGALDRYQVQSIEELAEKQQLRLSELPQLSELFLTIEQPLIPVLWQMEKTGILLDTKKLTALGVEITTAIQEAEKELKKEMSEDINLNSAIQVGTFLAEKLQVPLSKTKTGRYATNETELSQHRQTFPIIAKLLAYRELTKLQSTYVESLLSKVDEKSRIHTSYNHVAVSTGRLSSSNPNLQNIPVSSSFGQKIKSCFVAGPGKTFLSFDYSQQELRILAHLAGEERLIAAFAQHKDVHTLTASQLFTVPYAQVTKEQRMVAKTINFGIIYGMSSFGMSVGLTIGVEEAQNFIDRFYQTYPNIKTYYEKYLLEGKKNGFVETLLGRRRFVFEYENQKFISNAMRRVLLNYPIQGTAADLMRKAMVVVYEQIVQPSSEIHLLLQIHDDLVFEVPDDPVLIDQVVQEVKKIMCHIYPLSVPVEVDVKRGKNWGEMETYTEKA